MGKVEPDCRYGYSGPRLEEMLGDRYDDFCQWISGQTMLICDGMRYDPNTGGLVPDCEPGHGIVAYPWDVDRFLAGQPIID